MNLVTLEQAKAHLRIDDDASDADIALKLAAAESYALAYLNRSLPWGHEDDSGSEVPASVEAAILLVLGGLFEQRESVVAGSISENPAVKALLNPFRRVRFA